MTTMIYAAKVPLRTAYLKLANRWTKGDWHTQMLKRYGVDLVFDVGANNGQYARALIRGGYQGRIVSIEPLPSAFEKLRLNSAWFSRWQVTHCALGAVNDQATLNVAGNAQSSSLLPMSDRLTESDEGLAYVDTVEVPVKRLDEIIDGYCTADERVFLKMDVQGLEHDVIEGAHGCLDRIIGLEMELSTQTLYDGSPLWDESIRLASSLGFVPTSIQSGYCDAKTGLMLQADCTFVRESIAMNPASMPGHDDWQVSNQDVVQTS